MKVSKLSIALIAIVASTTISAKTIEIKDTKDDVALYAMAGAASACKYSKKLTAIQTIEIDAIYDDIRQQLNERIGFGWSSTIASKAANETYGFGSVLDQPTYEQCSAALISK